MDASFVGVPLYMRETLEEILRDQGRLITKPTTGRRGGGVAVLNPRDDVGAHVKDLPDSLVMAYARQAAYAAQIPQIQQIQYGC